MSSSIGTIYKRKDGRWEGAITIGTTANGNPRRKRVYGRTKTEVATKLAELQIAHATGKLSDSPDMTLRAWMTQWHRSRHHLAPSTRRSYEGMMSHHIFPWIGDKRLNDLRPIDLRNLYTLLTEGGLSLRSVRYAHFLVKSALNTAVQMELAHRNVAQIVKPEGKNNRKEITVWTAEEVQAFLKAAKGHNLYALFYLVLNTGLRRGEVLALRWSDLNLKDKTLHVHRTYSKGYDADFIFKEPKTSNSRRTLHISQDLINVLQRHRRRQELTYSILADWPEDDLIFTTQIGTPIHPDNLRRSLHSIAEEAGIKTISIHGLRHTYTSLAMSQTNRPLPVKVISRRLGHADVGFTLRIYQHIYDTQLEDSALTMDELITSPSDEDEDEIQDVDWRPTDPVQDDNDED